MDITTADFAERIARTAANIERILGPEAATPVDQVCDTCRTPTGFTTTHPQAKVTCDSCFNLQYKYDVDGKEF